MEHLLKVENISKSFPGVLAVDDVSFTLRQGEILALLGENGAGKSTLTQMLGGVLKPDQGQIILERRPVSFASSHDAIQAGISMVFQELSLVGSLSIAENIFANRQPVGLLNNIRWRNLYQKTKLFLQRFNLDLDPKTSVKNLSIGQQQILEILKAISTNPKILILDEPTSSLAEEETEYLFDNIHKLQEQGMSFIYITHKLSEVFQITNRVMVMRDGKYIGSKDVNEVTENDLVSMMVGREITNLYGSASDKPLGDECFRVEHFSRKGAFQGITFGLQKGEILGFAGLVGAGRTELGRSIFGVTPKDAGEVFLDGEQIKISGPQDAIKKGIAYLTEDRKGMGLFLSMPIRDNVVAPSLKQFTSPVGFLESRKIDRFVGDKIKQFSITTPSILQKLVNLSGGNQQKCMVAMWMGIQPKVIIFDEPTRGVDVGARADIYQKLREFALAGTGVIIISSELPELIGMCDRIIVMHEGRITGEVKREDFSEELILSFAAGLDKVTRFQSLSSNLWERVKSEARPVLEKLSELTSNTIHLAVLDESEVVYLDKVDPSQLLSMYSQIGRRAPAYCTGVGKALLAWSPPTVVHQISQKLVRFTDNTITEPARLREVLEEIRAEGYAVDNEEHEDGIRCVAVPVRDNGGKVVAALSISGSSLEFDEDRISYYKQQALASAEEISQRLEYSSRSANLENGVI